MSDEPSMEIEAVLRAERQALGLRPGEEARLSALCISGGGIRSATFGLGAIQGLAEHGLLEKFDYLSTVSGGGYIGSWLTAWVNREKGIAKVIPRLRPDAPPPAPGEPDPIQHLRDYNSFLSPRVGAFSTDLWTLIAAVFRNILLNWMVLIPLLMAVLIVPRLYLSLMDFAELWDTAVAPVCQDGQRLNKYCDPRYKAISEHWLVFLFLPALVEALFTIALYNTLHCLPGVGGCNHTRKDYARKVLAPLVAAVLTFMVFDSLYWPGSPWTTIIPPWKYILAVSLPCVAAWVLYVLYAAFGPRPQSRPLRRLDTLLPFALVAMAAGTGAAVWAVDTYVLWSDTFLWMDTSWAMSATLGPPLILLGYCLGTVLFVGFSSYTLADADREWMSRSVGGVLLFAVAWTCVCGVVLLVPAWALAWPKWGDGALAAAGALSAWLSTAETAFVANANPGAAQTRGPARVLPAVASLAPPVFMALLACGLSLFTNLLLYGVHVLASTVSIDPSIDWLLAGKTSIGTSIGWTNHHGILKHSKPLLLALLAVSLVALSWIMARFVNVNTFSLHGMYRDRLIRAYLGASNSVREKPDAGVNRFTGFCASDNITMAAPDPRHQMLTLDPTLRPFHVVNLTLNLVAGNRLAWQQRKAAPFTVTPLSCGSSVTGYRPSSEYGGGISLGTAMAISGAAASPSMGYYSSPVVGFIMTLFNARLGVWLGNPGAPGERTWKLAGPAFAIRSLLNEALGQTSDQSEYVYLSDGGHFENLGLYEMVRRRCRLIVVLDSASDPGFTCDDLGNALRKIRIDLRIPIDFDDEPMRLLREGKRRWALAAIRYSEVDAAVQDGRLVYIKPMLLGKEPPDVLSYHAAHKAFPHQSTSDQWFDESQTESYRQLGLFTVADMCHGRSADSLAEWGRHLERGGIQATADARSIQP